MAKYNLSKIGKRFKKLRKNKGLLQKDFAASLEVSVTTLSDIETGKVKPGFEVLFHLCMVHRVNLEYLFCGKGKCYISADSDAGLDIMDRFRREGGFGESTGDIVEILECMRRSRLARGAITSFAREYMYRNEDIIRKDVERSENSSTDKDNLEEPGGLE